MDDWKEETIKGYNAFVKRVEELSHLKPHLFVLFTGSPNANGVSWCPDCVQFEAVFHQLKQKTTLKGTLLTVEVGNRDEWKNKDSPFRTDPKLRLASIPTIMQWGGPRKLSDSDILSESLVSMLLTEED